MGLCDVVALDKPKVYRDDYGWRCEQDTICRKCNSVGPETLADEVTWPEALAAAAEARVLPIGEEAAD